MRIAPVGFAALVLLAACSGGYALPGNDGGLGGPFTRDPPPPSRDTPPPSQDPPSQGAGNCVIACDQSYACNVTITVNGQTTSLAGGFTFVTQNGQCVESDDTSTIFQCDGTVLAVDDAGVTVVGRAQATGGGGFQLCTTVKEQACFACTPTTQDVTNPPQPGGALVDGG